MRALAPIILIGCSIFINSDRSWHNDDRSSKHIPLSYHLPPSSDLKFILDPAELNYDPIIHEYTKNIFHFILAELAEYRQQLPIASENLLLLFPKNQDPVIAKKLTELAINSDDYPLASAAVTAWANLAPYDHNAQLIAVIILIDQDHTLTAKYLNQAIKDNPTIETQLNQIFLHLNPVQQDLLLKLLEELTQKDQTDPMKYLCLANLQIQFNQIKSAQKNVKIALRLDPSLTNAIILQAKLIKHKTKSDLIPLDYLKKQVVKFAHNEPLRIFYAKVLLDNSKNQEALNILSPVINSSNNHTKIEASLLATEIYLQKPTINLKQAKKYLNNLLNSNLANSKVFLLLGEIAEIELNFLEAIKFYTLIEDNPYHFIAYVRAALLLAEQQQVSLGLATLNQIETENSLEKKQLTLLKVEFLVELQDLTAAINCINQELEVLPEDLDLLYTSSMLYRMSNQLELAAKNLKKIISLQPEHHIALNELGSILTNIAGKEKEAWDYLNQALKLSPQNPLYMDNIGMLLYKMGKVTEALIWLQEAYSISANVNIATHLGEVLWANGDHMQAKFIWQKAWQIEPNNLELIQILNYYQVFFAKPS